MLLSAKCLSGDSSEKEIGGDLSDANSKEAKDALSKIIEAVEYYFKDQPIPLGISIAARKQ